MFSFDKIDNPDLKKFIKIYTKKYILLLQIAFIVLILGIYRVFEKKF